MKRKIELSAHAELAMAERRIAVHWIERVMRQPEFMHQDAIRPHRILAFGRIDEFGGRWLRVVYERVGNTDRVVTAFFDRKAEKRT
ncbi:MAG: DUF4258 domain-containing protein [Methylocystis sp.]|nr:DUF4258 domain-containing protein [Methylocystis sp.]MBI3274888.1 DUF4258 domain-containing protein [Methylocystis sp.]